MKIQKWSVEELAQVKEEDNTFVLCWPLDKMRRLAQAAGLPERFDAKQFLDLTESHEGFGEDQIAPAERMRVLCLLLTEDLANKWLVKVLGEKWGSPGALGRKLYMVSSRRKPGLRGRELYWMSFVSGQQQEARDNKYDTLGGENYFDQLAEVLDEVASD